MDTITYLYAPITKSDNATRTISGPISGPDNVDSDGHIVDTAWLRRAIGPYMQFGNVRQQHNPQKPIGKAIAADLTASDGVPVVTARIVDNDAWRLCQEGVLSGFSIGIRNPTIVKDAEAPQGRIIGGILTEISCVDHPSNAHARYQICKSIDASGVDGWLDTQSGLVIEREDEPTLEKSADEGHTMTSCDTCGLPDDACSCLSYDAPEVAKAADDFTRQKVSPLIKPTTTMPSLDGEGARSDAEHADSPPFNLDTILSNVKSQLEAYAKSVSKTTGSGFSPNRIHEAVDGHAGRDLHEAGEPGAKTIEPGYPGEDAQHWDGVKSHNAPTQAKSVDGIDETTIRKICGDVVQEALADLFAEGLLTKAATSGTTKAAVQDLIKGAIASATVGFETRLAQVEQSAMPAKGVQNNLPNLIEKSYALNPAEKQVVDGAIHEMVTKSSDTDQIAMVAQFLSQYTHRNPGMPTA